MKMLGNGNGSTALTAAFGLVAFRCLRFLIAVTLKINRSLSWSSLSAVGMAERVASFSEQLFPSSGFFAVPSVLAHNQLGLKCSCRFLGSDVVIPCLMKHYLRIIQLVEHLYI
jgi:hypothetical protein